MGPQRGEGVEMGGVRRGAAAVVVVLWALVGAVGGSAADAMPTRPVSPDLRQRLDQAPDQARLNVIVRTRVAPSSLLGSFKAMLGDFGVARTVPLIDAFTATMTKAQIVSLAGRDDVVSVEANDLVESLDGSANTSTGVMKARADAPALDGSRDGSPAYSSSDLVAAIVDSGIDASHADLDEGKVLVFADCVSGSTCVVGAPYDDAGHGTSVASVLAGDGDATAAGDPESSTGVAPGAALVVVKVLNAAGQATEGQVLGAIQWVVDHKGAYNIRVLNLSLGGSERSDGTDAVSLAADAAVAAGLFVTVAAGNDGPFAGTVGSPASARSVLTVGAVADPGVGGFLNAYFSSRGPTTDGRPKPDISAPGVAMVSAWAQTGTPAGGPGPTARHVVSGTSFSAPFAAGVALLMLDADPTLTPAQLKAKLIGTARGWDGAPTVPDNIFGAGRLDAYAALQAAGAAIASPPVAPAQTFYSGRLAPGEVQRFMVPVPTSDPIAVTLNVAESFSGPGGGPDVDLILRDPLGDIVGLSPNNSIHAPFNDPQEDVFFFPGRFGLYTIELRAAGAAASWQTFISAIAAPSTGGAAVENVSPPGYDGDFDGGGEATGFTGLWNGAPPLFASFQWLRCDDSGANCVEIADATGQKYSPVFADVNRRLRFRVTVARSGAASVPSTSPATPAIRGIKPRAVSGQAISGSSVQGSSLTINPGTWYGTAPISFSYSWRRCPPGVGPDYFCPLAGLGPTYLLGADDIGSVVVGWMQATNGSGFSNAVEAGRTSIVTAAGSGSSSGGGGGSSGGTPGGGSSGGGGGGGGGEPPDLELSGAPDRSSARVGETILYRLRVRLVNVEGSSGASNVVVTHALPDGLEPLSAKANRGPGCTTQTRTVSCPLDFISAGTIGEIELLARASSAGTHVLRATVSASETDAKPTNNTVALTVDAGTTSAPSPTPAPPAAPVSGSRSGTAGADTLVGTSRNDTLKGLGGNDRLSGGRGNDRLEGGAGADRLDGGPGRDTLLGGVGNDTLLARDATRDLVDCGPGRDTAFVDRFDVVRNCETVRRS